MQKCIWDLFNIIALYHVTGMRGKNHSSPSPCINYCCNKRDVVLLLYISLIFFYFKHTNYALNHTNLQEFQDNISSINHLASKDCYFNFISGLVCDKDLHPIIQIKMICHSQITPLQYKIWQYFIWFAGFKVAPTFFRS